MQVRHHLRNFSNGDYLKSMRKLQRSFFVLLFFFMSYQPMIAHNEKCESDPAVTNKFWSNWYGQLGVNMNLMFPYGYNVKGVFPNGKSFGVNIAVGKWFSPEFGTRIKLCWGNGILKNDHNIWLRPFGEPGENHRKGGFMTFLGDAQLNIHNLLGDFQSNRKWNIIVGPRAGFWIDVGSGDGSPILGLAVTNTFRLNEKWRLFADVGYHFIASLNSLTSSGTGHGSNGFVDINVGIEMDLSSNNRFRKASVVKENNTKSVVVNSFWDNWFAQAGLGMSLINPYGTNIKNVFPNGSTLGINVGVGKWFTPDVGVRGGLNLQNSILINHHASYLDPREGSEGDPNKHGFVSLYADVFFNLHNIVKGYDETRKWNAILYPRMGLVNCFSSEFQECPVVGLGMEHTYAISTKWKLYADLAYQVTTGGFLDSKFMTGVGCNSNGWFDINVGVQYELGQAIGWQKPSKVHGSDSGFRVNDGHNWPRFIVNTIGSVGVAYVGKTALKAMIKEERPDHTDNKSFPSGHAAIAFAAARSIDKEFRKESIWIPIAGYAAATAVGIERIASDRHHWYDVVAGAAVGYGAAELTWWLSDLMFGKGSNVAVGSSGNTVDVAVTW